ncbi:MAG: sel1 repeat family protein [Clostridiales bacterium]|nr:sel1 repeat family protein [Clostridiales bacterium]
MFDLGIIGKRLLKTVEKEFVPSYTAMAMLQEQKGSIEAATQWYIMAAERGETIAMHNLGCNALAQSDLDAAIQWFSMASEAGKAQSAHNLGCIYRDMLADLDAAEQAFLQGAQLGFLPSMNSLGVIMVETGRIGEGIRWITRAAERGQESAKNNLVYIYSTPEYGIYQPQEAEYWRKRMILKLSCDEILI